MKTPEEIKRGLECCAIRKTCAECPYKDGKLSEACMNTLEAEALAYIRKLEKMCDAEPVRHGRWVENVVVDTRAWPPYSYKNGYACSLCDRITRTNNEPYCHCGAKMDLEVE